MLVKRSTTRRQGFTLVELAVVVAIIGILAAVAIPKLLSLIDTSERAMGRELFAQLNTAAGAYTAQQSTYPDGFDDFVVATGAATSPITLSLSNVGTIKGGCAVASTYIDCNDAFTTSVNSSGPTDFSYYYDSTDGTITTTVP